LLSHLLFEQLTVEELLQLDRFSSLNQCTAGDWLYRANTPASHIYVLVDGTVGLTLFDILSKAQVTLSELVSGEIFGVASIVGNRCYTSNAMALDDCRVLSIESKPFLDLLHANPRAGMQFAQGVARVFFDRYMDLRAAYFK